MPLFKHLPARKIQEVTDVVGGQPAFWGLWLSLTQVLGRLQHRLPKPIVETHHQAGPRVTKSLKTLQHPLHILQRIQGVG